MPYHRSLLPMARRTALLSVALLSLGAASSWAAEEAGVVRQVVGAATASTGAETRPLNAAAAVFVEDLVKTGDNARLGLGLGERTVLNLGARTEIRIDRYLKDAGGEINLVQGTMLFDRKGKPGATELTIKSPYGLIAVRGTSFHAGRLADGRFGVLVSTGRVVVTGGGRGVAVGAGQGTFITRAGAKPSPPKPWSTQAVREIRAAVF